MKPVLLSKILPIKTFSCFGLLCAATALLAGCGGSSAPSHTVTHTARLTPAASGADVGTSPAQLAQRDSGSAQAPRTTQAHARSVHAATVHHAAQGNRTPAHATAVVHARPTPASSRDDNTGKAASAFNPCKLVSLSEAQAITGGAIGRSVEAPLGPTCIYSGKTAKAGVTLAVQPLNFSQATHELAKRHTVIVSGHKGYCGQLGREILFIPLAQHQTLNVTAPCGVAQRFATLALSRFTA